ncbi:hypothetical protein A4C53_RS18955 [Elizabethkingia anophelis]|uniref:hypothetical protein n=1 Tax=Elizabethkingia TaxID=308865 RepID=UPI00077E5765|nr:MULTISPECIES: hypothetical protein [Elizabethkingia]AMR42075.1 hypothetical protein A2T74_12305 [Elizabethkingia anophelis]AMX48715.1 hypothetical protein A4C56_12305 [Elizabethkingia anophelis]AMX52173.1 hypothetical protein A2T72_12305 [Elizabethkingia anophelis]AMX55562.1 hypothetical protein A2T59_12305 [Elizabethkingia anophelis]EGT4347961.1 hypothetical protein [Elizabethkingia anophelis]
MKSHIEDSNHRLNQKRMDKTLDDLLNYLKSTIFIEDQNYIQFIPAVEIFFFCYGDKLKDVHNYTEPDIFLEKLYRDGYVNYNESEESYQINLNGIEFINNGGYTTKTKKIKYQGYWNYLKIFAVIVNAALLLIFAYASLKKDLDEAKEKKKEIKNNVHGNRMKDGK